MEGICKCELCGHEIEVGEFDEVEELLWGHIQMDHEEEFEEAQDLETPYMIAGYFECVPVIILMND